MVASQFFSVSKRNLHAVKRCWFLLSVVALFVSALCYDSSMVLGLFVEELLADTTADHTGGSSHHGIGSIVAPIVNFSIFAVVLYALLNAKIRAAWQERVANLEQSVKKGREELAAAQRKLQEALQAKESLAYELVTLEKNILSQTSREVEELNRLAEERIRKIQRDSEIKMALQQRLSASSLHAEFVDSVIEEAASRLRDAFSLEKDKQFRKDVLEDAARSTH